MLGYGLCAALVLILILGSGVVSSEGELAHYLVGVDYFPAWHYNACRFGDEWTPIKIAQSWNVSAERQPKVPLAYLGYYDDTLSSTWDRQIILAKKYGIGFFLFQYNWKQGSIPEFTIKTDQVLDALVNSPSVGGIKFAVNWVDFGINTAYSEAYFTSLLDHIARYLRHPSYLRIDNKPVIGMLHWHNVVGSHLDQISNSMRKWAKAQGFPDLYLVGSAIDPAYDPVDLGAGKAFRNGLDAVTALGAPMVGTAFNSQAIPGGGSAPYDALIQPLTRMWYDAARGLSRWSPSPRGMNGERGTS